jgi:transcription elongation factor Elf1
MKEKRTYADRAAYLIKAVAKRRKKIRQMAVEYKGGNCIFCNYSKYVGALDFHHVKNNGKDFGISEKGYTRSRKRVKQELDKCILVCANCHREIHAGLLQPPKETLRRKSGKLSGSPTLSAKRR